MNRILIADDSKPIRQLLQFVLEGAGYRVDAACDGSEALTMAQNRHYDLVITDINMPNMNGIELIQALRQLNDYCGLPILTLTTEATSPVKQQGREAGATGWIVKPFIPKKLLDAVQRLFGDHHHSPTQVAA